MDNEITFTRSCGRDQQTGQLKFEKSNWHDSVTTVPLMLLVIFTCEDTYTSSLAP